MGVTGVDDGDSVVSLVHSIEDGYCEAGQTEWNRGLFI